MMKTTILILALALLTVTAFAGMPSSATDRLYQSYVETADGNTSVRVKLSTDSYTALNNTYLRVDAANDPVTGNLALGSDGVGPGLSIFSNTAGTYWEWLANSNVNAYKQGNLIFAGYNFVFDNFAGIDISNGLYVGLSSSKARIIFDDLTQNAIRFLSTWIGIGIAPWQELTVSGDVTITDDTPNLVFRDSDDNTAYAFHLETASSNAPWQNLALWRGTDTGTGFSVDPNVPMMYFDNANDVYFKNGFTGTFTEGGGKTVTVKGGVITSVQ